LDIHTRDEHGKSEPSRPSVEATVGIDTGATPVSPEVSSEPKTSRPGSPNAKSLTKNAPSYTTQGVATHDSLEPIFASGSSWLSSTSPNNYIKAINPSTDREAFDPRKNSGFYIGCFIQF
jgi:hypothetical protein